MKENQKTELDLSGISLGVLSTSGKGMKEIN